jgi:hypothetical protein
LTAVFPTGTGTPAQVGGYFQKAKPPLAFLVAIVFVPCHNIVLCPTTLKECICKACPALHITKMSQNLVKFLQS